MKKFGVLICLICMLTGALGACFCEESAKEPETMNEAWYDEMLEKAVLNRGNNIRIKNVVERAKNGEEITIAVIGGSITEGAGAAQYKDCWACKVLEGFRKRYGVEDGKNIKLVNAGVGGTASTFGWMRWDRDILQRVKDTDGLPDLVIVEYAVNDGQEPTKHRCYESMVRSILEQPNAPAVILLFSVFPSGYTMQRDLAPIGYAYRLMMISMADSAFKYLGDKWTQKEYYFDQYHPTSLGHGVMADCILHGIEAAVEAETDAADLTLPEKPVAGINFMGLKSIFRDSVDESLQLVTGSFDGNDSGAYRNQPVGLVCGKNFYHDGKHGNEPLTFKASFRELLLAIRTTPDKTSGKVEIKIDGEHVLNVNPHTSGSWGQSDVFWVFHGSECAEHTVEILMAEGEEEKKCTVTGIAYAP